MTVKEIFIDQFKATYNEENWFVSITATLSDVTEEEFNKKPHEGSHTIRQLVNHLNFWNDRWLNRLKGTPKEPFTGDNDLTFNDETEGQSKENIIKRLNQVMDGILTEIEKIEEGKLSERVFPGTEYPDLWWHSVSNIILHNAYHGGQIMQIKKQIRSK